MRPFASVWAARHHLVYVLTILLRNGNLLWHVFERSYRVSVLWSYLHPQGLITMSFVSTPSLFLLKGRKRSYPRVPWTRGHVSRFSCPAGAQVSPRHLQAIRTCMYGMVGVVRT